MSTSDRERPDRARPTLSSRIGVSVPTAIGAVLFASVIAFGSGMADGFLPFHAGTDQDKPADTATDGADGTSNDTGGDWHDGQGDKPAAFFYEDAQQPDHGTPDKTPRPEPTPKPEPKPTDQPKSEPQPPTTTGLTLEVLSADGRVKLHWSVYGGDGFGYYKLVRSSDDPVAWPLGPGDSLAAYANDPNDTYYKDVPACGKEWHYRVFAVTSGSYAVLAASNTVAAFVPCVDKPTPPPPTEMGFSAEVVDGQVHLTWEECGSDSFVVYKVVRSQTNPNPKYPLNDGTELIAAIGDQGVTSFVDGNVTSGQTWYYRVLSLGDDGWGWYALGMTPVLTVTIP